ncbi:hypothetical protein NHG29_01765 [Aerococcaceae bacterium NML160702]|nr:hypothetical protein [Aerococcaceae bacterium NML160702]
MNLYAVVAGSERRIFSDYKDAISFFRDVLSKINEDNDFIDEDVRAYLYKINLKDLYESIEYSDAIKEHIDEYLFEIEYSKSTLLMTRYWEIDEEATLDYLEDCKKDGIEPIYKYIMYEKEVQNEKQTS